jgi:hypothetical protein
MRFPIRANSGTRGEARDKGGRRYGPLQKEALGAYRGVAELYHRRRGQKMHPASGLAIRIARCRGWFAVEAGERPNAAGRSPDGGIRAT